MLCVVYCMNYFMRPTFVATGLFMFVCSLIADSWSRFPPGKTRLTTFAEIASRSLIRVATISSATSAYENKAHVRTAPRLSSLTMLGHPDTESLATMRASNVRNPSESRCWRYSAELAASLSAHVTKTPPRPSDTIAGTGVDGRFKEDRCFCHGVGRPQCSRDREVSSRRRGRARHREPPSRGFADLSGAMRSFADGGASRSRSAACVVLLEGRKVAAPPQCQVTFTSIAGCLDGPAARRVWKSDPDARAVPQPDRRQAGGRRLGPDVPQPQSAHGRGR